MFVLQSSSFFTLGSVILLFNGVPMVFVIPALAEKLNHNDDRFLPLLSRQALVTQSVCPENWVNVSY